MADMTDLDNIFENDLMDALGDLGNIVNSDEQEVSITQPVEQSIEPEKQSINIDSSSANIDSIANLLKELLNNKTIEITIKIKDN